MKKLNGVVFDGKFYEVVNKDFPGCQGCAFINALQSHMPVFRWRCYLPPQSENHRQNKQ